MAEANMFNLLPDEIILKIFEHSTAVDARSIYAQVDDRFNRLSSDKHWRKQIIFKRSEIPALLEEAEKCADLQKLIQADEDGIIRRYKFIGRSYMSRGSFDNGGLIEALPGIFDKFNKSLKVIDIFIMSTDFWFISRKEYLELNCTDSTLDDLVVACPAIFSQVLLESFGDKPVLEDFLIRSKHIVKYFNCRRFILTAKTLSILAECSHLESLFIDSLVIGPTEEDIELKPLKKIRYLKICKEHDGTPPLRWDKFHSVFLIENLETLQIDEQFLTRVGNILVICKRLEKLTVDRYITLLSFQQTLDFYKALMDTFEEHETCMEIHVNSSIEESTITSVEFKERILNELPDYYSIIDGPFMIIRKLILDL